ncbi:hypothetical protein ACWKWU_14140 [Chitinophaga lutea]
MKKTTKENLTGKALADSKVYPHGLSVNEKWEADRELRILRREHWNKRSAKEQLRDSLMQLKYQMEDVIKATEYHENLHYGYFLSSYIRLLNKKQKEFAAEISIDETRLSRIIHQKEMPNDELYIRLELHSQSLIPAIYWFQLAAKKKAHEIGTSREMRKVEKQYVLKTIQ